ncbi:MAG TPA: hypothetical protein VKE41_07850 [Roseiflexaceae bacterium]|nr:hypothetical protein [Roseiflexaceae bacterium]
MSDELLLSRRQALKFALAATVTLFARSQLPGVTLLERGQQALLPTRLAALLTHTESAKVIGAEYLQQYPQEADTRILLDQIASHPAAGDVGLLGAIDENLGQVLNRMVRQDFGADRVVELRGWILSRTEARLCALATLL